VRDSVGAAVSDVGESVEELTLSRVEGCVEEASILENVAVSLAKVGDDEGSSVGRDVLEEAPSSVDDDVISTLEEVAPPVGEGVAISIDGESVADGVALSREEDRISVELEEDSAVAEVVISTEDDAVSEALEVTEGSSAGVALA
jgi:hypothetical protein